jgi:hypothetical protein
MEPLLGEDRPQARQTFSDRRLWRPRGREPGLEPAQMFAKLSGVCGCDQIEPGIGLIAPGCRGHAFKKFQDLRQ